MFAIELRSLELPERQAAMLETPESRIALLISFWRWLPCCTATAKGCSANGSPISVKLQFW